MCFQLARRTAIGPWAVVFMGLFIHSTVHAEEEYVTVTLAKRMQEFVDSGQVSGVVALVGHSRRVDVVPIGYADLQSKRPMKANTLFRIMSMTKPITATAVMILVDERRLSLDDPVEKYIPAFAAAKTKDGEPLGGLKIRHLLTHTSGLVGTQTCEKSLEATAEMLAARPFGFQPGTKWEYGPSLNVCGRVIEVVSGKRYEDFVDERITHPLAMSDTTFFPRKSQIERMAVVDVPSEDKKSLVPAKDLVIDPARETVPNPSGGLVSTAFDMHRFYEMVMFGGAVDGVRILSPESVRLMTTVQTGDLTTGFTPGNGWGLGWCVVRQPQGVTEMLSAGTFGHGGKYGTQGWIDPKRRAIFVLMFQREELANSDGSEIRREFQRLAVAGLEK